MKYKFNNNKAGNYLDHINLELGMHKHTWSAKHIKIKC